MIETDFRDSLIALLGDEYEPVGKVALGHNEQGTGLPFVWYMRGSELTDRDLSGEAISIEITWDVECVGSNPSDSIEIASAIKQSLDGYQGAFGSRTAWKIEVSDHSDDYLARSIGADDGYYVAALQIIATLAAEN